MQTRNPSPLIVSLFAVLAVVYPVLGVRTSQGNDAIAAKSLKGISATSEGSSEKQGFPTAKDMVARFLFSQAAGQASPAEKAGVQPYSIELLVATAPDPIDSRLPNFFDSFVESIASAAEATDYTSDRFAFPWTAEAETGQKSRSLWRETLHDSVPGLILFRNPRKQQLLLVFVVGETPTTGIHKPAMLSALDQMAQFYPWDPHHSELPPGFPQVDRLSSFDVLRVMGPAFSGSAVSLRFVLDSWLKSRGNNPNLRFQIISGSATAIDTSRFSEVGHGQAAFHATVPPDRETLQAAACYIQHLGYPRIAILTERNTAYGQNLAHDIAEGGKGSAQPQMLCRDTTEVPEILDLPFPLHISELREASVEKAGSAPQTGSGNGSAKPAPEPLASSDAVVPPEALPPFSELTVQSAELTLSNLLTTIERERFTYVGILATDVRDATFLAQEVKWRAPATVLFTFNSDLLYAYPSVNRYTRGMLVITPYPLFNLEQLWTYPYRGGQSRLQFSSQAAEGVYNATMALLGQDAKLVDYGGPLSRPGGVPSPPEHKPALWVTAIGNGETLPISLLRWEDRSAYTYSPAPAAVPGDPQTEGQGKPNVGRGLYNEDAVVVVIVLSLLLSAFSVLMISQYQTSAQKRSSDRISALLGDTASPAYWSEGRLFLLCCCASLLTFYIVVMVDFCLPFIAGRELGRSVQTSLTPKVAIVLAGITILLLVFATQALASAFRAAPAGQRGSAREVTIFALLSCAFVFVLVVLLVVSWYKTVKEYPASGLFSFLRSFDLRGGLSPLLPLACVALGACLWGLCSFRRLHLIDILRASGSVEKGDSWLSFLSLEGRSFTGVRELENNIKQNLECASVISVRGYTALLALAGVVGYYFFSERLVRALEARPFYWVFEASFFIVYWALLMECIRLVVAWRSLHVLLLRLSWHPLHAAFRRYHQRFPSHARMNLTHPPSSFASLEASVEQARRMLQTAKAMVQAAGTEQGLCELLRPSLPEWESHVCTAESELYGALRLEWTDPRQVNDDSPLEPFRKKRATRLKGDWRKSLASRWRAHHALFQLLQSLAEPMEQHWSRSRAESPAATAFFEQVEEFIVTRVVNFLAVVFPSFQNLGYFVLVGLLLMLLAVTSYPFQPRNEFLFFNWVVILSFMGIIFWIFVQMDRDTVLSLLNGGTPGQINISFELVLRGFLYIGAPLLALLGAQFPETLGKILSALTAAQGGG
ncbi:MAG: hypothetical protein ABSF46_03380 [Terriglobia bacterium]|jgi:hypothetical protein